ncbi:hypothetical protein D3C85_1487610 [compost metagenome]
MVAAPATELVYATAPMLGVVPPFIAPSVATTVPNSGCKRRFCPDDVTKRILSTVGLKFMLALVPLMAGVKGALPKAVAKPDSSLIK